MRAALLSDNLKSYPNIFLESGDRIECKIVKFVEKNRVVLSLDGISDRTSAEALKGQFLYVQKSDFSTLAEDEFYVCDLIGKRVRVIGNEHIECSITNVFNFGAGDLIEISHEDTTFLVPFTEENFPNSESEFECDPENEICMTRNAWNWYKN